MVRTHSLLALAALSLAQVRAIDLDVNSPDSIKSAASKLAHGMVSYYKGNETGEVPGNLPAPYWWWEAGAMFNTLINYWSLTGDAQYNAITTQAFVHQAGDNGDFMPLNQTKVLGNDDQSTWALASLAAAQAGLPASGSTPWSDLAQRVFDTQTLRWDTETCDGGLRWQIFSFNMGYDYKNAISNGQFFELSARLAHETGNSTFSDWASKVYKWATDVKLIDDKFNVFDGTLASTNCSQFDKSQFSNSAGTFIVGAAYMYNITTGDAQSKWKTTLDGLLKRSIEVFFPDGIATETACESKSTCNTDQKAFKGQLAQKLVDTTLAAPYTVAVIKPVLESSAKAAAKACTDDSCPPTWVGDGASASSGSGVGEQLSALSYVQGLLFGQRATSSGSKSGNATTTNAGTKGSAASPTASGSSSPTPVPGNGAGGAVMYEKSLVVVFGVMWASMAWLA